MTESKDCLTPIDKLKVEIEFRYRILCYRKLYDNYVLNRMEKNNVNIMLKGMEDLRLDAKE